MLSQGASPALGTHSRGQTRKDTFAQWVYEGAAVPLFGLIPQCTSSCSF